MNKNEKVYKEKSIWTGIFLGGPLVAGYFFSKNFKAIGEPEKVKNTWIISVLSTILVLTVVFTLSEKFEIPNYLIPCIYSGIGFGLFKHYLAEKTENFIKSGGKTYKIGNIIGISLLGALVTIIPITIFSIMIEMKKEANIETKTYGNIIQNEISYSKDNINQIEIDNIAENLKKIELFNNSSASYLFIKKNENKYEIYISAIKGIENEPEGIQYFENLRNELEKEYPEKKIEFMLTFDYWDNVVKTLK